MLEASRADATQLACGQHDAAVTQAPTARQGVAAGHAAARAARPCGKACGSHQPKRRHRSEPRKQRASTESGGQSKRGMGSAAAQFQARSALHPRRNDRTSQGFPHARGARLRSR